MLRRPAGLALAALLLAVGPVRGQDGELTEVVLDEPGETWRTSIELATARLVHVVAVLPPPALGEITFHLSRDGSNWYGDFRRIVMEPGGYELEISAEGTSEAPFWIRIDLATPLDPWEPDDRRESARPVGLPARVRTILEPETSPDWLRFELAGPAVLSIQGFAADEAWARYRLEDAGGDERYATSEPYDAFCARYVLLEPGAYFLSLAGDGTIDLELALYDPRTAVARDGGMVLLGLEDGSVEKDQLDLIAGAAGLPLANTVSPAEILEELARAVEEPPPVRVVEDPPTGPTEPAPPEPPSPGSPAGPWIAVAIAAALALLALALRRLARRSAQKQKPL